MSGATVAQRRITPGTRMLALMALGVAILFIVDLAVLGIVAIMPAGGPWAPFLLLSLLLPFAMAYVLGTQAGRAQWWEAAIAALLGLAFHGLITATLTAGVMVLEGAGLGTVPAYLAIAGRRMFALDGIFSIGTGLRLAAIVAGAFLGARRSELPSMIARSLAWRRAGFAVLVAPAVIVILAALPGTVASVAGDRERGGESGSDVGRRAAPAQDSTAHLRDALMRVLEEQEMHYAESGYSYAATAEELGFARPGLDLEIAWADDLGWSGRTRDRGNPDLECAVYVGDVPVDYRPAGASASGRVVCSR